MWVVFRLLTTAVNFINVLRTNFLYKRCISAAFSSYMYIEKRRSYEKCIRKMLMKLTPGFPLFSHIAVLFSQQASVLLLLSIEQTVFSFPFPTFHNFVSWRRKNALIRIFCQWQQQFFTTRDKKYFWIIFLTYKTMRMESRKELGGKQNCIKHSQFLYWQQIRKVSSKLKSQPKKSSFVLITIGQVLLTIYFD